MSDPEVGRLADFRYPAPPHAVDMAVAAAQSSRRSLPPTRTYVLRAAGAVALVLVALTLIGYFAPISGTVLAGNAVGNPLLQLMGLEQLGPTFVPVADSSTSADTTIRLIAAHADQSETILVLSVKPDGRVIAGDPAHLSLTDQFGQVYYERAALFSPEGEQLLVFDPIRQPATSVGARLTLSISALQLPSKPRDQVLGHWSLHATVIAESLSRVPGATASAQLGTDVISVDSVDVSRSIIQVHLALIGPGASRLGTDVVVPGQKPQPAIALSLSGSQGNGHIVTYEVQGEGRVVVTWTRPGQGDYLLKAVALDGTSVQLRLVIR